MNTMQKLREALRSQQQGNLAFAEEAFRGILKEEPTNIHALNLLGALCVNSSRPQEGVDLIGQALKFNANDAQALFNFALGLKELGRYQEAVQALQKALKLNPKNVMAMNALGCVFIDSGTPLKAIPIFQSALKLQSNFIECWCNLSTALQHTKQFDQALLATERAIQLDSKAAQPQTALAELYRARASFGKAIQAYRAVLRLVPGNTKTMISLAETYRDSDQPEEARKILLELLELNPEHADGLNALGYLEEQSGNRLAAAENFQKAIAADPLKAIPHYRLAQLKGRKSSTEEVAAIRKLLTKTDIKDQERRYLFFALASILDEQDNPTEAFAAWKQGNDIEAKRFPYDANETQKYYRTVTAAFKNNSKRLERDNNDQLVAPLFIIGMPRSGTTLTGQILASHTRVSSLGEISFAFDMAASIVQQVGTEYPEGIDKISLSQITQLGAEYKERYPETLSDQAYIIDNTPLNFPHLGLLSLALPNAKFIHCVRNPIDTCFSIYKLPFSGDQTFAHSLEALASKYNDYWALMQEWKALIPGRILDVQYEKTVTDTYGQSQRMLQFLNLDYEESVLEFHRSKNLVRTPSASQVKEPIYKDAIQAWKKYEPSLEPLIRGLNPDLLVNF